MIGVTDLKAGTTFREDGNLYQVISYEHIKMGRGSANIKVKVKNLSNGSTVEKSYINGAKVDDVTVVKQELQFLYRDDEQAHFMNEQTYEQIDVPLKVIDQFEYLKEGEKFVISFLDDRALSVQFPPKMTFKVVDTPPGVKGNSATNVYKEALLENGLKTKVPLFIDNGDMIRVDTRTGAYSEKAN